jgi:hypothetical protein
MVMLKYYNDGKKVDSKCKWSYDSVCRMGQSMYYNAGKITVIIVFIYIVHCGMNFASKKEARWCT